jgi:hypothetical protein
VARDFNGSTDRIDYPSAFDTTGQAITISMWINADDDTPGANAFLFNSAVVGGTGGTVFYQVAGASTQLAFFRAGSLASLVHATTGSLFTAGTWAHVLATHDGVMTTGSSAHIYVNATEPSYVLTENGDTELTANSGFSLAGRTADDARNWDGKMAEVGVWNRVLSAAEIAALAKAYPPNDFPYLLKFYAPLVRDAHNFRGGADTLDGTTVYQHPRIIRRMPRLWRPNPAAAAPASTGNHRVIGGGWGGRFIGAPHVDW